MEFRTKPKARRPKPLAVADSTRAKARDPFRLLKIDPLWEVKNTALLGHYVTEMGKIRPRKETELTVRSQRRLAKAIKRAKMMGIIPLLGNPSMKNSTLIRPPQPAEKKDKKKSQSASA
jgi:small subunit ribosomal protein S18